MCYDYALYKCTFYLLTCLLTYSPKVGCWTWKFLDCGYLFTVLNSGLLFSQGRPPSQQLLGLVLFYDPTTRPTWHWPPLGFWAHVKYVRLQLCHVWQVTSTDLSARRRTRLSLSSAKRKSSCWLLSRTRQASTSSAPGTATVSHCRLLLHIAYFLPFVVKN